MRLWHYKLIPLVSQWRELNSIYKNQNRHILINYVYNYPKCYLHSYSMSVIEEIKLRGYKISKWGNFTEYFDDCLAKILDKHFPEHNVCVNL